MPPSFSIVINTLNRGAALREALASFQWLQYDGRFEVIVVNGPSTDDSEDVIAAWAPRIRSAKCPVANLSVSRNIGICMARGDIVAFIDDDAIPEPEWLAQLASAYEDPIVGAAGGLVYDHTGYAFQYRFCTVDRFGEADLSPTAAQPELCFPKSYRFPHLLGCNSSFRRAALLEIGGFDEEYEYFLDETDVCLRIVDAGWLIAQVDGAYVHHKYAPSSIRGTNRVVKHRYPVIKNKVYFTLKHAREFHPLQRVLEEHQAFVQQHRSDVDWAVDEGLLEPKDREAFTRDAERALETGLRRGLEGPRGDAMIDDAKLRAFAGEFLPFAPIRIDRRRTIVLVSRDYPPVRVGGIATFTRDLAQALAALGHTVHVVTASDDLDRVDFEAGAWVHRMVPREQAMPERVRTQRVPVHVWNWSATARAECERIATHRSIDVVEAPIWDCEGVAFLDDRRWPLVTSLHTTLGFYMDSHPEKAADAGWMESFGAPMLALEARLMTEVDAVRANSAAIVDAIESRYGVSLPRDGLHVVHHGLEPADQAPSVPAGANDGVEALFVGRLEPRKGIDLLLAAIPSLAEAQPDLRFTIVGENTLPGPDGRPYMDAFLERHERAPWRGRVQFRGRVDEQSLGRAYAGCDLFVAPSRFESFGLVFLEAMRVGKPVVGCVAGGVPEVVADGETGLLVPPDDPVALGEAILRLARDRGLRERLGRAGLETFKTRFTAERMARSSAALHETAAQHHRARRAA